METKQLRALCSQHPITTVSAGCDLCNAETPQEQARIFSTALGSAGLKIPISPGEFFDRYTILKLKTARIKNPNKARRAHDQLAALHQLVWLPGQELPLEPSLADLVKMLEECNGELWDVENDIREQELKVFPLENYSEEKWVEITRYMKLARSVCELNQRRTVIKEEINYHLHADNENDVKEYTKD